MLGVADEGKAGVFSLKAACVVGEDRFVPWDLTGGPPGGASCAVGRERAHERPKRSHGGLPGRCEVPVLDRAPCLETPGGHLCPASHRSEAPGKGSGGDRDWPLDAPGTQLCVVSAGLRSPVGYRGCRGRGGGPVNGVVPAVSLPSGVPSGSGLHGSRVCLSEGAARPPGPARWKAQRRGFVL